MTDVIYTARMTARMRSVVDDLRTLTRRRALELTAEARIEQALALGDEDARLFAAARGLALEQARRQLARARLTGRQSSRAADRS